MLDITKLLKKRERPVFTDVLRDRSKVFLAGHRGWCSDYPENTMAGFRAALEQDVDMLEFDLNLTRDKRLVVIHDETVDRTTDGTGVIREMDFDELRALDAGVKKNARFAGERIPAFEELCELITEYPHLMLNVEIKERTVETADLAVAMINRYGFLDRCVFTCFDARILEYLHDAYKLRTQGFHESHMLNFTPGRRGTYSKMFAVGIPMSELTPESVYEFEKLGILPWCYCPDTEREVYLATVCGARLMTCNDIGPALKVLHLAEPAEKEKNRR